MIKPVILSVDDEPQVANAIQRDLRPRYGRNYRILKTNSGAEGLELLQGLRKEERPVALLLADQRMPGMSGTEFLEAARELFPAARKVLLTAYADTEAAIASINRIDLDHYLLKPWDPPDQHLFPVLDELLEDWWSTADLPYDGIRVQGTLWSPASHEVKDFLSRNRIPYQWEDLEAEANPDRRGAETKTLPVIRFPDGTVLTRPSLRELAEKVGLQTEASAPYYDVIIVGGGPAGLAAGVYGASEGLKTLLVEREATGGQAGTSSRIENYLGFPRGLSGAELAKRATDQAIRLGCEILTTAEVESIRLEDQYKIVCLQGGKELTCRALVIATGVQLRQLKIPGAREFSGAGVYYGAALSEARYFTDQRVVVIGGANSAGQGAMFFSRYAREVLILVRADRLEKGMSAYLVEQIRSQSNIRVLTRAEALAFEGVARLEKVRIVHRDTGMEEVIAAPAAFIFIGARACTDWLPDPVACDPAGFVLTDTLLPRDGTQPKDWPLKRDPFFLETSVPGIFAAGDVRASAIRRVASAVGQGAMAISLVHQYLKEV